MEEEAKTKAKRPRTSANAPLTVEAAQEQILQKLAKAGAKGTAALPAKAKPSSPDAATYQQALAALEDEQRREVFVDRRDAKKPKYYLWAYRPKLPTAEDVARKLLTFARHAHPRIHHEAGLTKNAGLEKDEKKLVPAALLLLCENGSFAALEFAPSAKTKHKLYVATGIFASSENASGEVALHSTKDRTTERPLSLDDLKPAYDQLVRQVGFPAVPITSLQKAAGVSMEPLKELLRRERDAGRVVLSVGDWSIANEEERRGVIEMHGQQYLQVRWRQ